MQVFYAPDVTGDIYVPGEKESLHIIKVLRMRNGDAVNLIDGKGNLYEGIIENDNYRKCTIRIRNRIRDFEKRDYRLHIAISPLKNNERFEWFIEKSVEIGIDEITPLICSHTEKKSIKNERVRNIIISAMKQSLKAKEPVLNPPCFFSDFVKHKHEGVLMITGCNDRIVRKNLADIYTKGQPAVVLIGPEGDFSETETETALRNGFISVHLGKSRLRTETAGIAACHSIYFINL